METQIPDEALPVDLDRDNRLSSYYTTLTLFPFPGPVAFKNRIDFVSVIIIDFWLTVEVLEGIIRWENEFGQSFELPPVAPDWLGAEIQFDRRQTGVRAGLIRRTRPFSPKHPATVHPGAIDRIRVGTGALKAGVDAIKSVLENAPDGEVQVSVDQFGRLRLDPSGSLGGLYDQWLTPGGSLTAALAGATAAKPARMDAQLLQKELHAQQRAYQQADALHALAKAGLAVSSLLDGKHIQMSGSLLSDGLKQVATNSGKLVEFLNEQYTLIDDSELEVADDYLKLVAPKLEARGFASVVQQFGKQDFRRQAQRYVAGAYARYRPNGLAKLLSKNSLAPTDDREWAFQRTERLDLFPEKAVFRGPVSTQSVAPNSELSRSRQTVFSEGSVRSTRSLRSAERLSGETNTIGRRLGFALNNLTESSIQKEAEFTGTGTLLSTLSDRRRSIVESVIDRVSTENEAQSAQFSGVESTASDSYIARGIDDDQATTEVAFQVVSPVQVEVRLEDIGLVWCPRVFEPFIGLLNRLRDYTVDARREYVAQHLVGDPARPVERYEYGTFTQEIPADGTRRRANFPFEFLIPGNFEGWEVDADSSSVDFRNGTGDDYNWSDRWNLDDLENWHAELNSVTQEGSRVVGSVLMTTTDPELLNLGFLTITIGMRKQSAESVEASRQYQLTQQEVENERQAVETRALQYARMRRTELIEKYDNEFDLRETVFSVLIQRIFQTTDAEHRSYYKEVIRSSIDWEKAAIRFEHAEVAVMGNIEYPTDHFLNSPAVRFTLPILRRSEDAFFQALADGANDYHEASSNKVQDFVGNYREKIEQWKVDDAKELILDKFSREMVLGRHLEAVLSRTRFRA